MPRVPTDLQILDAIYEQYYATFAGYSKENPDRGAKIYVPIDLKALAGRFGVDLDIIFGRFYYHLNKKYSYKDDDGNSVSFFAMKVGPDMHCVNFPYVASILADLRAENRKYRLATSMASVSLFISVINFVLAGLR